MKCLLVLVLVYCCSNATEFLYPVAQGPDQDSLLFIYQKSSHHIELWQWDRYTKQADTILLSRYTPAGVRIVPSNVGFSFIDNGRIRVKKWIKRSPRNIELDGPVGMIELINWIDEHTFYTSGRYKGYFGIFHIDDEGTVYPVLFDGVADYTYPQRVDNTLFCVKRTKDNHYMIIKVPYHIQGYGDDEFYERMQVYKPNVQDMLVEGDVSPIIFLKMVNMREGFYVTHPRAISKKDTIILFSYHHLIQQEGNWQSIKLFEFTIPTGLLLVGKKSRLYEALLPLLPRHYNGYIFYSDCGSSSYLNVYRYCMQSRHVSQITQGVSHLFSPIFLNDCMYYGGELCEQLLRVPRMEVIDEQIRILLGSLRI